MKLTIILCFLLLICCQACKRQILSPAADMDLQYDTLVDQMIAAQRDFMVALESVRDLETAQDSAEQIRICAIRLDEISTEFRRLGPMSPALRAQMLNKLDTEEYRESTRVRESVRVLTQEEAEIIAPAAEMFFEKWGAASMRGNLDETSAEYHNRKAQPPAGGDGEPAPQP